MDKHKDKNLNNEKVAKTDPVNELRVAFRREKRKGQDCNLKNLGLGFFKLCRAVVSCFGQTPNNRQLLCFSVIN